MKKSVFFFFFKGVSAFRYVEGGGQAGKKEGDIF